MDFFSGVCLGGVVLTRLGQVTANIVSTAIPLISRHLPLNSHLIQCSMHLFANVHLTKFDMHIFWLANIFISWMYVLWFVFCLTCLCFTLWWIERMFSLHPESCLVLCISLSNNKSVLLYIYIYIYIYIHICTTIRVLKYNFWALRTIFPCGRWVLMRMEYNPPVEQRSNVFKTILKGRWHHLLSLSWSNSDKLWPAFMPPWWAGHICRDAKPNNTLILSAGPR